MIVPVPYDYSAQQGTIELPPGFRLGAMGAAYPSEGSATTDGRGPSIWDTFTTETGRVSDGSTGSVAADHYRHWERDLDLLAEHGVDNYRFSISWSRVQPDGRGAVNQAGLDFYDRLVDGLLKRGITPTATLYHWDLPQGLEDDAGWMNRSTINHFAEYAGIVGERLADRVGHWIPIDQPHVHALFGYGVGAHAPGRQLGIHFLPVAHHLLVGHGVAVQQLRAAGATSIGCANNHAPIWPVSDDPADVGASKLFDAVWNGMPLEAMLMGRYPADLDMLVEEVLAPGDMATIRQPLDFYGMSYSEPMLIGASAVDSALPFAQRRLLGHAITQDGSAVVPEGLREWLVVTRGRYRAAMPPLVVTELAAAYEADPGDVTRDPHRVAYFKGHLEALRVAAHRGLDVQGAFVGPLLDGFNWSKGFSVNTGMVHVDPETGARTPKDSLKWLGETIGAQMGSVG